MSDYLSSLIARNVDNADTIQPRTASIFEPVTTGKGLALPEVSQTTDLETVEVADPEAPEKHRHLRPADQALSRVGDLFPQPGAGVHSPAGWPRLDGQHDRSALDQPADTALRTILPPRAAPQAPIDAEARLEHKVPEAPDDSYTEPVSPIRKRRIEDRSREEPDVSMEFRPRPADRQIETPPTQPAGYTPAPVTPAESLHITPRASLEAPGIVTEAKSEDQPPKVHVSIGRLEVRVTQAAPPPTRSKRHSPVMDLDDYLRRRNGEEAR